MQLQSNLYIFGLIELIFQYYCVKNYYHLHAATMRLRLSRIFFTTTFLILAGILLLVRRSFNEVTQVNKHHLRSEGRKTFVKNYSRRLTFAGTNFAWYTPLITSSILLKKERYFSASDALPELGFVISGMRSP